MSTSQLAYALGTYTVAFLLTWGLTPFAGYLSRRFGLVDRPNARKIHQRPTPKAGGVAILFSFVLATSGTILFTRSDTVTVLVFLTLSVFVALVGWIDDKVELTPWQKLSALSVPALVWSGLQHGLTVEGLLRTSIDTGFLLVAMNAANLIDGMDGLASGVGSIAATFLALVGFLQQDPVLGLLALALAGATAGFLPHNFHPASIFMGDTGSLLIGFTLGALGLRATTGGVLSAELPIALGVLALPLLDTLITIARRRLHQRPIFAPDKSHTYNLLTRLGFSHRGTVFICYGFTGLFGALSCFYAGMASIWGRLGLIGLATLMVGLIVARFNFWQVDPENGTNTAS